ncbi:MAG: hypothetical protein WCA37_02140 [Terracidiphilus sp.]
MRFSFAASFLCSALCLVTPGFNQAQSRSAASPAPLPNATELMQRALANQKKLAAQRERYECRVSDETIETDSKGNLKRKTDEVDDQFYVNGVAIQRTLSKNGADLSGDQARKEDAKVMKETLKYNNEANAKKEIDKQDQQVEDLLEAMMLTNGHRQQVNGRSVLFYDILPNPHFQAKNMNQRFAQVMQGTMSVDEETGELMDLNIKSMQDLKIAGGLLANLHKGFWLHVHNQRQPDGVWLTDLAEGSGDARAMLFVHPYFRFKETTDNCHLYTATATQVGSANPVQ